MVKVDFDNYFQTDAVEVSEKNVVECSLNLSQDNADKILSLTGKVYQATADKEDGALVYGGLAAFNVVFAGDELMRTEVGAKFSFKTALPDKDCEVANVEYSLYGVKIKSDGVMLYATAELVATITYIVTEEKQFVTSVDALTKTGEFCQYPEKRFSSAFDVEDKFDAPKIKRVLYSGAEAFIKTVRAETDAAIVEGETVISVFMLPFSENGDIIKEVRRVPFRFECDAGGVDEDCAATANVKVDKIFIKVFTDDDKNRCSVSAKVDLIITGMAQKTVQATYVEDCYLADRELLPAHTKLSANRLSGHKYTTARVSGRLNCAVPEYARFVKLFGETVETGEVTLDGGVIKAEGVIYGNALFENSENALISNAFQLPFSLSVPTDADNISGLTLVADEMTCKLRSGALEAETEMFISYDE